VGQVGGLPAADRGLPRRGLAAPRRAARAGRGGRGAARRRPSAACDARPRRPGRDRRGVDGGAGGAPVRPGADPVPPRRHGRGRRGRRRLGARRGAAARRCGADLRDRGSGLRHPRRTHPSRLRRRAALQCRDPEHDGLWRHQAAGGRGAGAGEPRSAARPAPAAVRLRRDHARHTAPRAGPGGGGRQGRRSRRRRLAGNHSEVGASGGDTTGLLPGGRGVAGDGA
jgi:hypothetical protein